MKFFYTILSLSAPFFCMAQVQSSSVLSSIPINSEQKLHQPAFIPQKHFSSPSTQSVVSFVIDHDSSDAFAWNTASKRYLWKMNMNNVKKDSSFRYCVVAFDSLYDVYNTTGYKYSNVTSVTIDSIFAFIGQENNSGLNDTLRVKIVSVDANGYPTTTVLWSKDSIIPFNKSLSQGNQWNYVSVLAWNPAFTLVGAKKFAVRLEFLGSKLDTTAFLAALHPRMGACGANPNALLADVTYFSKIKNGNNNFFANSFTYWSQYDTLLPTPSAGNIYYECNGNTTFEAGVDGVNYVQNIDVFARVTINTTDGVNEYPSANGLKLMGAYPNPAHDFTTIRCRIDAPTNISVDVFDLMGRVVAHSSEKLTAGNHDLKISLKEVASGNYYYTVRTEGAQLTSKFVVIK